MRFPFKDSNIDLTFREIVHNNLLISWWDIYVMVAHIQYLVWTYPNGGIIVTIYQRVGLGRIIYSYYLNHRQCCDVSNKYTIFYFSHSIEILFS